MSPRHIQKFVTFSFNAGQKNHLNQHTFIMKYTFFFHILKAENKGKLQQLLK